MQVFHKLDDVPAGFGLSLVIMVGEWFAMLYACVANPTCAAGASADMLTPVLGAQVAGVGLAVEDDVEGQPHRLLGWQVAERDGGNEAVEDPIGPLLPWEGRHRTIVVRTRSAPGRCP